MRHRDGMTIQASVRKMCRMTYYTIRGRVARNCYVCDLNRCKCDAITMRRVKRGARQQWRREIDAQVSDLVPFT